MARRDSSRSGSVSRSSRPHVVGWTVFALSVIVTVSVHLLFLRSEANTRTRAFNRSVDAQVHALREIARNFESRLEALRTLFEFSDDVTNADFVGAGHKVLKSLPSLDAIEWAPLVRAGERAAFEQSMRARGAKDFAIRNRTNPDEKLVPAVAPSAEEYLPVIYRVPIRDSSEAFGFNIFTALRRKAALLARSTGEIQMSERGQLFDHPAGVDGFLLYLPVFEA